MKSKLFTAHIIEGEKGRLKRDYSSPNLCSQEEKSRAMRESVFQSRLKKELNEVLDDPIIFKTDCLQIQGFPDLLILCHDRWAALECKGDAESSHRWNQDWWIDKLNSMSYASFVYPENKEVVLRDLERLFSS